MQQPEAGESKSAVVFIHGFMGSPKQFLYLEPVARAYGSDAYALHLPGHGGSLGEFVRSNRTLWEEYVLAEIDKLRDQYDQLLLVGHSMGCLLAANAALRNPEKIAGILAIALPLHMRVSLQGLKVNWRYVTGRMRKQDDRMQAAKDFCGVNGVFLWNAARMLPRVMDVLVLCKQARKEIGNLPVLLLAVYSPKDEWVSLRSLSLAKKKLQQAEFITLKESGHFWYVDYERAIIRDTLARMLEKQTR